MARRELKVCVGASSGGHMTELAALLEQQDCWPVAPSVYVTSLELSASSLPPGVAHHVIGECDRNQPLNAMRTIARAWSVARRERPDVVITTGSLPLAIFCLLCKAMGAHIVWIDSVSQIERLSLSGRLIRPFADLFLVQWPELAARYPGVTYAGELA